MAATATIAVNPMTIMPNINIAVIGSNLRVRLVSSSVSLNYPQTSTSVPQKSV